VPFASFPLPPFSFFFSGESGGSTSLFFSFSPLIETLHTNPAEPPCPLSYPAERPACPGFIFSKLLDLPYQPTQQFTPQYWCLVRLGGDIQYPAPRLPSWQCFCMTISNFLIGSGPLYPNTEACTWFVSEIHEFSSKSAAHSQST